MAKRTERFAAVPGSRNRTGTGTADGGPLPDEPGKPSLSEKLLCRQDLHNLPSPEPLIDDVLDQGTTALLYGPWGSGKSFIALDWALSVATSRAWQTRATEERSVLYVAAEGAFGYRARVDAWEQGWQTKIQHGGHVFDMLPEPVNLTDRFEVMAFAELIRWGGYGFIVFDTLARCMVGADENSAKDCGVVVDVLNRLRQCTPDGRGVVLATHHTGKDGKTFRGSSVFEAGADTVYSVNTDGGVIILNREKRKDGPQQDRYELRLDPIPGTDSVTVSASNLSTWGGQNPSRADKLLSIFVQHFLSTGASKAELRLIAEMPNATFHRALSDLVESGRLINIGTDKRAFYKTGSK